MPSGLEIHAQPDLDSPVLIVGLEGWIDAGTGAATAMAHLKGQLSPTLLATFDPDAFIDFRARRPTLEIRDGVNSNVVWPEITLSYGQDSSGTDVILLSGHEPDSQWYRFCDLVRGVALEFGARLMVGLGAYPIGVPHTRPSMVACTASTPEMAASSGLLRNSVDVPAGVSAALERSMAEAHLPAIGLWAQVPHYAAAMAYPGAALALIETLNSIADMAIDPAELRSATITQRERLDQLVSQSAEHVSLVQQLEQGYDALIGSTDGLSIPGEPLPSGDELAAELEKFLRDQGN